MLWDFAKSSTEKVLFPKTWGLRCMKRCHILGHTWGFLNKAKPKSEEDFGSYFAKQVQGYCI